ncbi:MAG: PASTA domain-containing protein [Synergistaceae bacterium]|nr:PASTA domain-containing protein [Synergistaceae bacterium]
MGKILKIVLLFVMMIIFASGGIAVYTVFLRPEVEGVVPDLRERSIVDAVAEAERLGFVVQVEYAASTLPEGRVLAQSPNSGVKSRKGQVIVLQVSQGGGELHAVPDVRGKTLADAQNLIKSQGFSLGDVIRIREPNTEAGKVIAQSPAFPANISSGRKIDLLVQEGSASNGNITIPDVNRMTEKEARTVLEAAGVKVQGVDRVYSPLLPEGLAIETKPAAGSAIKAGQSVILKLATQKRPAGFMDSDSNNPNVRRVTNQPQNQPAPAPAAPAKPANNNRVSVQVPGQEEVFIGDDYVTIPEPAPSRTQANNNNRTQTQTPAPSQPASTPAPAPASTGGSKTARIRYVVPPIARPMDLRIEITDPSGKRNVLSRQVRSGESINTTASYTNECVISIFLGGESVWQERQK